jgi:hypothetical protein
MHTLQEVVEEYGDSCWYCECGAAETIDHVIPRAKGGGDHLGNLRPCCSIDNAIKGTMLPAEFEMYQQTAGYRLKYREGYGTFRSGIERRARKRAADKARKIAQQRMKHAGRAGDSLSVAEAKADAKAAIVAAADLRINWEMVDASTSDGVWEQVKQQVDETVFVSV